MADDGRNRAGAGGTSGGGSGWLAFVVGGLVVAVGVLAWIYMGGSADAPSGGDVNVTVEETDGGTHGAGGSGADATAGSDAGADAGSDDGGAHTGN